jgi:hypothetical protein
MASRGTVKLLSLDRGDDPGNCCPRSCAAGKSFPGFLPTKGHQFDCFSISHRMFNYQPCHMKFFNLKLILHLSNEKSPPKSIVFSCTKFVSMLVLSSNYDVTITSENFITCIMWGTVSTWNGVELISPVGNKNHRMGQTWIYQRWDQMPKRSKHPLSTSHTSHNLHFQIT